MNVGNTARVFAQNAMWKATGSRSAGRSLVRDLGSEDESVRMLAGMFLVRGGERAAPLLREAAARGENLPTVLTALADVGNPADEPFLRRYVDDPDPDVRRAARDGLEVLAMRTRASPAR